MSKFKYTVNWFTEVNQLADILKNNNPKDELHFMEIGSYEGRSTTWFLQNFMKNEKSTITCLDPWLPYSQVDNKDVEFNLNGVKNTFLHNIKATGQDKQVRIKEGFSNTSLFDKEVRDRQYDLIFIDGNHTSKFVLEDAVLSWGLLKVGGIMVFDDYKWRLDERITLRPKMAADNFVQAYGDYLKVVYNGYRLGVQKIKE